LAALLLSALPSCSVWFFSGESWVDRSRPVALVETTGGIEFGATTEFGVLTLGRSASEGPCRVHYFLGPTPLVEDGELKSTDSLFTRAEIDLKTQAVRVLDHSPPPDDKLLVMWTPDGVSVRSVSVTLAVDEGVEGDVLADPGVELPIGATVLWRDLDGNLQFAGLVAGKATLTNAGSTRHYFVFAGIDRVREMLAVPTPHPIDYTPKYRTDDISVLKPMKPAEAPTPQEPEKAEKPEKTPKQEQPPKK
ncbi:MAG: hypothetical protein ABIP94_14600, partial [Planctomycetota bacterium]